jgi:hypothetical protein
MLSTHAAVFRACCKARDLIYLQFCPKSTMLWATTNLSQVMQSFGLVLSLPSSANALIKFLKHHLTLLIFHGTGSALKKTKYILAAEAEKPILISVYCKSSSLKMLCMGLKADNLFLCTAAFRHD